MDELDSDIFGANVCKIVDIDESILFSDFEKEYIKKYSPKYVYSKVPIEEIKKIHYLESANFEFIETQMQLFKRLTKLYDLSIFEDKLLVQKVTNEKDLDKIYDVSDRCFKFIDRVYIDEKLPINIAQDRYHIYLEKSFKNKNQKFDKLVDLSIGEIIGFHTLLYKDNKSVTLLLGGVLPEYHSSGANYILDYSVYNDLYNSGHKNITTHVSARNTKVINYLTKVLDFKLKKTFVVLRKIY